jgi:dimethylglycine dehydrogenase
MAAGTPLGMRPIGMRAQDSLRLEKGYGVWSLEFAQSYTAAMAGLERYIAFDKGEFIGRDAALAERASGPKQRLVLLSVESDDADVTGFEPVLAGDRRVGFVTSGAYGHHVRQSLALAYVDEELAREPKPLSVDVLGISREARILAEPPYDPRGLNVRA